MKTFLDTAELVEINKFLKLGVIDGITTNPTILKSAGVKNPLEVWRKIIELIRQYRREPLSLSTEVFTDNAGDMVTQALEFRDALQYPDLAIKIPILGLDGKDRLDVIENLALLGVKVNCTACVTTVQAQAAAAAGATFVSLLYRRIIDEFDKNVAMGKWMIETTREYLEKRGLKAEIIVGSIRVPNDVYHAAKAGAHIVTIPPKFMLNHPKSVETQRQFLTDAGVLSEEKK